MANKKKAPQQGLFTKKVKVSAYVRAQGQLPPRAANGQWKKKARKS